MNVSKSEILDPESSDAAVKLALAETHVIQETKTYLESHGVVLAAFSERGRSETIILVKNIPYGTTAEQLHEMFGVHGELQRVLVPPAGTLAVIEFVHADEARKAFHALAYRRLGNSVMYLEKGPLGMFRPTSSISEVGNGITPVTIEDPDAGDDANLDLTGGKTIFVKNVAFATSSERFTEAFHHLPGFAFARLQTKQDPKRPGARLSMGFGFVGFRTAEAARKALKGLQGHVLDGHTLSVKFAGRGAEGQEDERKGEREKAKTTKMLVKNVPFEATRKDIQQLFGYVTQTYLTSLKLNSTIVIPVHMVSSNPSACPNASTVVRVALRSSSSSRGTRRRMHLMRSGTRTCSDATLCWSGRRKGT
jgi:multiple RNA-binding domain-containing protein 1